MICVSPDRIEEMWAHTKEMVGRAYEIGGGDSDFETEEREILAGRKLLWFAWREPQILAVAVTELVKVPRFKMCLITACSGTIMPSWIKFIGAIEEYARAEGCDLVRLYGRRGWQRVLLDYSSPWIALEKRL